jgi:general secretion pathway protein I
LTTPDKRLPTAAARRAARGFTLLEVMVALVIVAIAFVGLLGHHVHNLAIVGHDQDLTRAALLARGLITQMELVEKFPDTGVSTGEFDGYPGFVWEREVTDTDLPSVRRVALRISSANQGPATFELLYFIRDTRDPDQSQ